MSTINTLAVAVTAMWPVWAFVGILFAALIVEAAVIRHNAAVKVKARRVDHRTWKRGA